MSKNIAIYKAEFHKIFNINEEHEEVIDRILFIDKFVYPLEDKDCYYLYDVEKKELLSKNKEIETFEIDSNTEILSFTGVPFDKVSKLKIPKNIKHVIFEGGDLVSSHMAESLEGFTVWQHIINLVNLFKLAEDIDARLIFEDDLRNIYNNELPKYVTDIGLSQFLQKIDNSNIVNLTIAYVYFTDFDFKILSKLTELKELEILYSYNDNIRYLPQNLSRLKIYGHTIQNLSEVNLNIKSLRELELGGNAIRNLDNLSELPRKLVDLTLTNNVIKNFNIDELPKELEYLDLGKNLIDNDFFNQKAEHKNLKYLILSENKIIITTSVLNQISYYFPNLEYIELFGNETDGVPVDFIGDSENKNCLHLIQIFLDGIEFMHNGEELTILNSRNFNDFTEIIWQNNQLPIKVILGDIQYTFSQYLINMPFFYQYVNGIYCFIEHDECEVFIIVDDEKKKIKFRIQSNKPETVLLYFHKYFHEIQDIICFNSHFSALPFITYSKTCDFIKDFHSKAFKLDYRVKSDFVLKPSNNNINVLVNNRLIEETEEKGNDGVKLYGNYYENINNIGFILVSGKSAYPFILKEGALTNLSEVHNNYYYNLTLRDSSEKESYIRGITNKYLNSSALEEVEIFIDNNVKKKVSCFINPNHFHANDKILSLINPKFPELNERYLTDVKMDNNKWCEFNVEDNLIELKYVL